MLEAQLNMFDAAVLGIVGLSALVAFFRGFVREVLSLGAWIGAAIVTIYFFPAATALVKPHIKSTVVATGVGTLGLYITALIVISLFNRLILRYLKPGKEVGVMDNLLGLAFGALRGAVIVSLAFLMFGFVVPEKEYPAWLLEAKTLKYVEMGAEAIRNAAPKYFKDGVDEIKEAGGETDKKKDDEMRAGENGAAADKATSVELREDEQ